MGKETELKGADQVVFESGFKARIMGIDGTWWRECYIEVISQSGAKITVDGSVQNLKLNEFFLMLSTVGNAHPHIVGPVALVHNGIIENFKPLRDELIAEGRTFESETDTEVVGHLVAREVERGSSPQDAVAAVLPRLTGAFAIAFLFRDHPDLIIGARMGAPLTVGYGEGENYLGSDALAVAPWTQRISYLDEGDWAVVHRDRIEIFDRDNRLDRDAMNRSRMRVQTACGAHHRPGGAEQGNARSRGTVSG